MHRIQLGTDWIVEVVVNEKKRKKMFSFAVMNGSAEFDGQIESYKYTFAGSH